MTNDDLTNRELSAEELEAVAAGWGLGSIVHWVKHEVETVVHHAIPIVKEIAKGIEDRVLHPWKDGKSL